MPPLLEMNSIDKSFGATRALYHVSFRAHAGQVLALVGENGAGKSTLMKVLSGAVVPDQGHMTLAGQPYAPRNPHEAHRRGVAMIYQELNLASHLSVADNIMLGHECHRLGWLDRRSQHRQVQRVLQQLGHGELDPDMPVQKLPVGMQQLVEIARALLVDARVVVFDEPTSSLTRDDVARLFQVIRRLKQDQRAVIYISHFLDEVREIADQYTVLRDGEAVGSGSVSEVSDSQLVALMVGRRVDQLFPSVPHRVGDVLLSLEDLRGESMSDAVTLQLHRGEILGLAGLVGAGRTELLRSIYALDPVRSGRVRVGTYVPAPCPRARIRAGLGYVSEDRKGEGLAVRWTIEDNMTLSRLKPYQLAGWLRTRQRRNAVQQWIDQLRIKAVSVDQAVASLSGGNQQKVALARVLHQQADALLLDEPTRGIDVGTKAEIYRTMGQLAAQGKAILFVSSYLPELLAVCDRVAVMARGRIQAVRPAAQWTEHEAIAAALEVHRFEV